MISNSRNRLPVRVLVTGAALACLLPAIGCNQKWDYYALRGVQADVPGLLDEQWSHRREYSEAEMFAVHPGGAQTVLVARESKPPRYNDVAQLDEAVSRTFVIVLDGEPRMGKTYHVTPGNGRVIEGTTFRPAWRPYRGLEGDLTIVGMSKDTITAAVRVTSLTLRNTDPERRMTGVHEFKIATGMEPGLRKAQVNFAGGAQ